MTLVALRLADETIASIDAEARAGGLSRSAWIARAIGDALGQAESGARLISGDPDKTKTITMRFPLDEIAAMERVAGEAGLTRAQWIKRCLRWQLWDRAGELRLVPSSYRSILKLVTQTRAIGRSLNQAVKAMNAANQPQSGVDIQSPARAVIAMRDELAAQIDTATLGLSEIAAGEVFYWTGKRRKVRRRGPAQ